MNENYSGTNTVLIVIVILILAGLVIWFTSYRSAPAPDNGSLDVNVELPTGGTDGGGTGGGGTGTGGGQPQQ